MGGEGERKIFVLHCVLLGSQSVVLKLISIFLIYQLLKQFAEKSREKRKLWPNIERFDSCTILKEIGFGKKSHLFLYQTTDYIRSSSTTKADHF